MLSVREQGEPGTLLVMIHWLGGSRRSWNDVSQRLAPHGVHCVAVDLPGFGEMVDATDFSIAAMVRYLVETIRRVRQGQTDRPWFLAGHSMGGKLAAIVAREAENAVEGLQNLRGVVLLSPSPPGPEPMDEGRREQTLRSLGQRSLDAEENRAHAAKFVDDNTGKLPLLEAVRERSIEDVLRMNPEALVAWMTGGSKENWSEQVGVLTVPALVLAGTEEQALGLEAQKVHTLPHFYRAALTSLHGGGHLAPMERPSEVADRMLEFFGELGFSKQAVRPGLGAPFAAILDSDKTFSQTRNVLLGRMTDGPHKPAVLTIEELRILRSLAARVIPEAGFDLAARIDVALAQPQHDGWRFSALPGDSEAWQRGLFSLDAAAEREFGVPFVALDAGRQDDLLRRAQKGNLGKGLLGFLPFGGSGKVFDAAQMRDWFEDVRGELTKLYVADPRTMERIGFTGFADEQGFTHIGLATTQEVQL